MVDIILRISVYFISNINIEEKRNEKSKIELNDNDKGISLVKTKLFPIRNSILCQKTY